MEVAAGSGVAGLGAAAEAQRVAIVGFRYPDGVGPSILIQNTFFLMAPRSPDASWVLRTRLDTFSKKQKKRFLPLCPDFVRRADIALGSPQQSEAKMRDRSPTAIFPSSHRRVTVPAVRCGSRGWPRERNGDKPATWIRERSGSSHDTPVTAKDSRKWASVRRAGERGLSLISHNVDFKGVGWLCPRSRGVRRTNDLGNAADTLSEHRNRRPSGGCARSASARALNVGRYAVLRSSSGRRGVCPHFRIAASSLWRL